MKLWTIIIFLGISTLLYSQDCDYTGEAKIKYYQVNNEGNQELPEGLFLDLNCGIPGMRDSNFLYADVSHNLQWEDPDATRPQVIRFFLFRDIPETSTPSLEELLELTVISDSGLPIAFEPNTNIWIGGLLEQGKLFYLIPALVNDTGGESPDELFEGDCIRLLPDNKIKVIHPTGHIDYAAEEGMGLFRFPQWPEEVAITRFMDITVRDEYSNPVPFTFYDNRTIRLHLTRKDGFYDIILNHKKTSCRFATKLSYPYPLPLVRLHLDTVSGFRDREVCIPVTARNMNSITDFTIPFYFHPDSLRFSHLRNVHPLLE